MGRWMGLRLAAYSCLYEDDPDRPMYYNQINIS